jgi:3-dehydroquinate dehydratase-2
LEGEPGNQTFEDYFAILKDKFATDEITYFQRELIDKIQELGFTYDGIILNAGAYTHTSIAIGDAIKAITTPVIEVHISKLFA